MNTLADAFSSRLQGHCTACVKLYPEKTVTVRQARHPTMAVTEEQARLAEVRDIRCSDCVMHCYMHGPSFALLSVLRHDHVQPEAAADSKLEAWRMDETEADQRQEHRCCVYNQSPAHRKLQAAIRTPCFHKRKFDSARNCPSQGAMQYVTSSSAQAPKDDYNCTKSPGVGASVEECSSLPGYPAARTASSFLCG